MTYQCFKNKSEIVVPVDKEDFTNNNNNNNNNNSNHDEVINESTNINDLPQPLSSADNIGAEL